MAAATPKPLAGAAFPSLLFVQGNEQRKIQLEHTPFHIGRKVENDLVIADPRVSRDHATITFEEDAFYLVDQGSKHGTFVNGEKVTKHHLKRNDRIELGVRGEACVLFDPDKIPPSPSREFLSQISILKPPSGAGAATDLETLTLFLEAARKLNTSTVLEEVLVTLIDATLRLTKAERGYVFLRQENGTLKLAAGRNSRGEPLMDDNTISRSILRDAMAAASEFLLTDNEDFSKMAARESIVAHSLRTVICIPLRKTQIQDRRETHGEDLGAHLNGVLYLDSKLLSGRLTQVSHDILRAISTEAAGLVENAFLVQAEEAARRYHQELNIAASIQQRLMQVTIPDVPYARVQARNIPSKEVGGDFFDVVASTDALNVVVADVSGKGISAALLASILQGLLYAQLTQDIPLRDVVSTANRFLCDKVMGEKYATLVIARLHPNGELEYVSCGHVPPLLIGKQVTVLENSNFPVGLLCDATFETSKTQLEDGGRLVVVTDGVTEAEDPAGEFFGPDRLKHLIPEAPQIEEIFSAVSKHCSGVPLNDDCTVLQLQYTASPVGASAVPTATLA